jgi:putative nucleotidyltransferase with HDIG domain
MTIVQKVKKFVEAECRKPSSQYGYEPFVFHFDPVADYAGKLARELGADEEVVTLAAWLHDIGSIMRGRKDHHLTGAKIAERKLREFGYPEEKIALVKKCILNHRGSQRKRRKSLEEKILAEADTMSNFDNIAGIFKAAFIFENLDQGEAKKSVREKLKNKWMHLHFKQSKKLIRPKYEAAMILLA